MTRQRTGRPLVRCSVTRDPGDSQSNTEQQERERDMRTKILVEITLDKEPANEHEVQALLDDITENYGRPTAALQFTPTTGPAFVESVQLLQLSVETARIAADVLGFERQRLVDIAAGEPNTATRRDIAEKANRLRTAAAFMSRRAVQS